MVSLSSSYLDIRIPLITVRIFLITAIIASLIFGILLPFSFLSVNYLYNHLIPTATIDLPVSNYVLNYDFTSIPPFIIIGKTLTPLYANQQTNREAERIFDSFDFDLSYDFKFKFNAFCQDNKYKYEPIMYKISIVSSHLVNTLSPYGSRAYIPKRFHLWPLTNNIHQLNNPQVLVSSMNTLILNCNDDNEYKKGVAVENLIPPFLKWMTPPIITKFEINSKDSRFEIDLFKNIRFNDYITEENRRHFTEGKFNILLEFNKDNIIIDPTKSEISINVSWKGLRYYLYNYKILSYIVSSFTLWITSSVVLVSTVGGLVLWREATGEDQEAEKTIFDEDNTEDTPIVLEGDIHRGFAGMDPGENIKFRIDVSEQTQRPAS